MSIFTIADFDLLSIDGLDKRKREDGNIRKTPCPMEPKIVSHGVIGKNGKMLARLIQSALLSKKKIKNEPWAPEILHLFSGALFPDPEGKSDNRRSIIFKPNKTYNSAARMTPKNEPVIPWVDGHALPCHTIPQWYKGLDQDLKDKVTNAISGELNIVDTMNTFMRMGRALYKIMESIKKHLLTVGLITHDHFLGPLSILICTAEQPCEEQSRHLDFDPDKLKSLDDRVKPLSVIVNPMEEVAKLFTFKKEGNEKLVHRFPTNTFVAFLGDLLHAGASYENNHIRFHAYILHPETLSAYSDNNIYDETAEEREVSEGETVNVAPCAETSDDSDDLDDGLGTRTRTRTRTTAGASGARKQTGYAGSTAPTKSTSTKSTTAKSSPAK